MNSIRKWICTTHEYFRMNTHLNIHLVQNISYGLRDYLRSPLMLCIISSHGNYLVQHRISVITSLETLWKVELWTRQDWTEPPDNKLKFVEQNGTLIAYREAKVGPEGDEVAICENAVGLRELLYCWIYWLVDFSKSNFIFTNGTALFVVWLLRSTRQSMHFFCYT